MTEEFSRICQRIGSLEKEIAELERKKLDIEFSLSAKRMHLQFELDDANMILDREERSGA